jgi:hypothetical protein
MAKARKIPSYRLHKPTGQAVVRLDGRDLYLGKHGTEKSHEEYRRRIAEWLTHDSAAPRTHHPTPILAAPLTVSELILAYWRHAEAYYQSCDGLPSSELDKIRLALRPLRQTYGSTPARDFGPIALKSVRQVMVESGLCRRTVNQRVTRIVRLFRFAVENELVPAWTSPPVAGARLRAKARNQETTNGEGTQGRSPASSSSRRSSESPSKVAASSRSRATWRSARALCEAGSRHSPPRASRRSPVRATYPPSRKSCVASGPRTNGSRWNATF